MSCVGLDITAPFSAIMIVGALVVVELTAGMIEASMTAALLSDPTGQDRAEQLPVLTVESRHLDLLDRGA